MFRLKKWPHDPNSIKRLCVIGTYTNNIVYERIAPQVLTELKKRNPPTETGHRKHRHHQLLTGDVGHPILKEHLASVMALMQASTTWDRFMRLINRALPRYGDTYELMLDDEGEDKI